MSILLQTKQRRLIKKENLPRDQADDNHVMVLHEAGWHFT
jgi:hypothetical protein